MTDSHNLKEDKERWLSDERGYEFLDLWLGGLCSVAENKVFQSANARRGMQITMPDLLRVEIMPGTFI